MIVAPAFAILFSILGSGFKAKNQAGLFHFLYYNAAMIVGTLALYDQPWFYDLAQCFEHGTTPSTSVAWYYAMTLGFYSHLLSSHWFEPVKKDFWVMLLHHICAFLLLALSWSASYSRIGSVIIWLHDLSDPFLEGAKQLKYYGYQNCCDVVFVLFALTFAVSRLIYFPFWVIHACMMLDNEWVFVALLSALLCMHVYWFGIVLRMVHKFAVRGSVEKDDRSDDD